MDAPTSTAATVSEVAAVAREDRTSSTKDCRDAAKIGRDARLELVFGVRRGRTVLLHGYAEPPFRVSRPFDAGDTLHMILTSSGPGVFGGDRFSIDVRVASGARIRLTSQSAVQVHPDVSGAAASIASTFDVEDGARLTCQWLPVIPFEASRLSQRIAIRLAGNGSLYWSDAFMSGRSAGGERWRLAELDHELRVMRAGALEYIERYRLNPTDPHLRNRWIAGDAAYFGTIVASGPGQTAAAVESVHARLADVHGTRTAVDFLPPHLSIARVTSPNGPAFHAARALVDEVLASDSTAFIYS